MSNKLMRIIRTVLDPQTSMRSYDGQVGALREAREKVTLRASELNDAIVEMRKRVLTNKGVSPQQQQRAGL